MALKASGLQIVLLACAFCFETQFFFNSWLRMHRKDCFPHNEAIIDNNIMAMESYIFFCVIVY